MHLQQRWINHRERIQCNHGLLVRRTGLAVILLPLVLATFPAANAANANHQALQTALTSICGSLESETSPSTQQLNLLETCTDVQVAIDQGFTLNLERLLSEETLIFQESITNLTDVRTSNMLRRLAQLRTSAQQIKSDENGSRDLTDVRTESGVGVYVNARTLLGQYETSGLEMDHDSYGVAVGIGADYLIQPGLLAGVSLGFTRQETDFFNIDGDSYVNAGNLSLYGSWLNQAIGYADVVLDLGYHRFNLRRKSNLFDETRQFALGKTDAFSTSMAATIGRDFSVWGFAIGPYARLALLHAEIDGYRETRAEGSSNSEHLLRVKSHTANSRRIAVGGQLSREFGRRVKLVPQFRLELVKELVDDKDDVQTGFLADATNTTIRIQGDDKDTEFANTALGLSLNFRSGLDASVFVVSRWLDDQYIQHWMKLGMEMTF